MTSARSISGRSISKEQNGLARPALRLVSSSPGPAAAAGRSESLRTLEAHLHRLRALSASRASPPVFSHWSAAVLHGLPLIAAPPSTVHVLSEAAMDAAARLDPEGGIVAHRPVDTGARVHVRGLWATDPARTVSDLAGRSSFLQGVAAADRALIARSPLTTAAALRFAAEAVRDPGERRRARRAVRFADPRSDSPLESVSRATIALAGAPTPELRVELPGPSGPRTRVAFCWPALGLVGEADDAARYHHPVFRGDRTGRQVLAARFERQRQIEALGFRVIRWGWPTASRVDRMRAFLVSEGVPLLSSSTLAGRA